MAKQDIVSNQREYMNVTIVTHGGIAASNPLKITEWKTLRALIENNRSVTTRIRKVSVEEYNEIFRHG